MWRRLLKKGFDLRDQQGQLSPNPFSSLATLVSNPLLHKSLYTAQYCVKYQFYSIVYVKVHALRKTSLSLSCLYLTPYLAAIYLVMLRYYLAFRLR